MDHFDDDRHSSVTGGAAGEQAVAGAPLCQFLDQLNHPCGYPADAQVLYCDPKSTHRLDQRTLPLQITVRDLGQLLVC
jgi:hypothetical protein